ncbi:MAG: TerB family tellurite resistance protein [SAR324 cluster bacterium]|nr:TerB family tellurite resistance protein [SAR324 cluster bacterium]
MLEDNQIIELFSQISRNKPEIKQWTALVIGYAVTADRIVQAKEIPSLITLIRIVREAPEISAILPDLLRSKRPVMDSTIEVPPEIAEKIFTCVLKICASDRKIQSEEYNFINQVGQTLKIKTSTIHQLVNSQIRNQNKASFFRQLLRQLNKEGRYWVSVVILKVILSDHRIDHRESHFLKDIYELLHRDSNLLEKAKLDAESTSLCDLPPVKIDEDTSLSILKYLLEIQMNGKELESQELRMIRDIANLLGYPSEKFDNIIESVKSEVENHP